MATYKIDTVDARARLKPRHTPYYQRLQSGCYLGFRKTTAKSAGAWVTRYRAPDSGKQTVHSLGTFEDLPPAQRFDAARLAADDWFRHLGRGGATKKVTVESACRDYEAHVRAKKGDAAAADIDARYRRWVYSDPRFASTQLARLTRMQVERWRANLAQAPVKIGRDADDQEPRKRTAGSVNREISALRAALNFAHDCGGVTTDQAWRVALRPEANADGQRSLYLDKDQRAKLIKNAPDDLARLLHGMASIPLRPGAVAALKIKWFDAKLGVITVGKDKKGKDRRVKLPPATVEAFSACVKDRADDEPIFLRADGKAWNKDAWKDPIKEAASAAGLPDGVVAYTLRHSLITDLVLLGVPLLTIAQISGTGVQMIERHYGHLRQDTATSALAELTL